MSASGTPLELNKDLIWELGWSEEMDNALAELEIEEDALWECLSEPNEDDIDMFEHFVPHALSGPPSSLFPQAMILCGLPCVPEEKIEKLKDVLKGKVLANFGDLKIFMKVNPETSVTDGGCVVTFSDPLTCAEAMKALDGLQFTTKNVLSTFKVDDFDSFLNFEKKYSEEELAKMPPLRARKIRQIQEQGDADPADLMKKLDRSDLTAWYHEDEQGNEMMLSRWGDETQVLKFDPLEKEPLLVYDGQEMKAKGKQWCSGNVQWSPLGSFVMTYHPQGVQLWGGEDYSLKMRFMHNEVQKAVFSPTEEYLLTWNGRTLSERDNEAVSVFCVRTGRLLRSFMTPALPTSFFRADDGPIEPLPAWSPSGKYLVRRNEKELSVIEVPSMKPAEDPTTGKRGPIKFSGLSCVEFSPSEDLLACWVPQQDEKPAKVVIVNVHTRKEVASRNIFNCKKPETYDPETKQPLPPGYPPPCKFYWSPSGDFLAVLLNKVSKSGKASGSAVEVFKLRSNGVPVDMVDFKDANVHHLAWEPKGSRFAVITTNAENQQRKLTLYGPSPSQHMKIAELNKMELPGTAFDRLYWAPHGTYWVMASTGKSMVTHTTTTAVGMLMFGRCCPDNRFEQIVKEETHYKLTNVEWAPSSRFVVTSVQQDLAHDEKTILKNQQDAGFFVWSFQGRILYKRPQEKLWNVQFRPHPQSLLKREEIKDILDNLPAYSKRYEEDDKRVQEEKRRDFLQARESLQSQFKDILASVEALKKGNPVAERWTQLQEAMEKEEAA